MLKIFLENKNHQTHFVWIDEDIILEEPPLLWCLHNYYYILKYCDGIEINDLSKSCPVKSLI